MSVQTISKASIAEFKASNQPSGCKCEAQIAGILARLEKVEREALTVEKLAGLPRASMFEVMWQRGDE